MLVKERQTESHFRADVLLSTLQAFRKGDFGVRMRGPRTGIAGEVSVALNDIFEQNERRGKTTGETQKR